MPLAESGESDRVISVEKQRSAREAASKAGSDADSADVSRLIERLMRGYDKRLRPNYKGQPIRSVPTFRSSPQVAKPRGSGVRRSVVKYGGQGESDQTIKLFQITPYVSDFQPLNNLGSWQPVGASKVVLPSIFDKFFILDDVKLAELSNNSFERKTDISGVITYSDPFCIFSGVTTQKPPGSMPLPSGYRSAMFEGLTDEH